MNQPVHQRAYAAWKAPAMSTIDYVGNVISNTTEDIAEASTFGPSVAQAIAATLSTVTGTAWKTIPHDGAYAVGIDINGTTNYWTA